MTRSTHPYGSDPSQLGELFLPSGTGPFAVVVVVHGGYWKAQYDRSLMTDLCLDLAAHGLAAWNLEYRRVGSGGGWPATLLDVAAGVDLLADLEAPLDLVACRGRRTLGGRTTRALGGIPPDTAGGCARCGSAGRYRRSRLTGRPARSHARSRSHAVVHADEGLSGRSVRALRALRACVSARTSASRHPAARAARRRRQLGLDAHRDQLCGSRARCRRPVRVPRALTHRALRAHRRRTPKRGMLLATGSSLR